jgi:putative DNA methylase
MTQHKKKLIEVALPLPEINDASAYDKMPGIGPHPKGIHHWWARLPLPTARAVLFASVVDDPSAHPEKWATEGAQDAERERLFAILRRMMGKKLHEHPEVYAEALAEMRMSMGGELPVVFDPFAGGGSIPLEANRLGLEAHAADLNPVAVLLNKCNLEIAPRWAGRAPVNPEDRKRIGGTEAWRGTNGLAADVRYYGRVIRDRAREKIGHLYPKAQLPKTHGGGEANVIAWIWARTVASPDPAARGAHVPLVSTFWLSSKKGNEAWLEPALDKAKGSWCFAVRTGAAKDRAAVRAGTKTGRGQFRCLLTGTPIPDDHVKAEGMAGRLGTALLAMVVEGRRGRVYLSADKEHQSAAQLDAPTVDSGEMPDNARWFSPPLFGLKTYTSLFTPRQLTAMVTLSDLVKAIGGDMRRDGQAAGFSADEADSYARAVTTFLALAVDRCADFNNALCRWKPSGQQSMQLFGRQAIPMMSDFVEPNIMGEKAVCWHTAVEICADAIETISSQPGNTTSARQIDAATGADGLKNLLVSTDPPYYDNIGYAALSDFFYVWLRRTIGDLYVDLFRTLLVPKMAELTAAPERFNGDKRSAKRHFESGFRKAFAALRDKMEPRFPLTVYYAFKQADEESAGDDEDADGDPGVDLTTGWETLLEALIWSGFQITATWPVRASQSWRMVSMGTNALASYIVLACRPRAEDATQADRRSFVAELKRDLPAALRHLQQGNIAPVDFAQAAIGPGMAIYSRYRQILETGGKAMTVRAALRLINQTLTEVLSEQEDDFDSDTRWAISWFDQHGFDEGEYGDAELLSKAKVTSVGGLDNAGLIRSRGGKVRLLRPIELAQDWDPATDKRFTVWEATHHLVRLYVHEQAGEESTAALLRRIGSRGEVARDLAYRLFDTSEKKKRSQEAQAYNALVLGWPEIARLAREGAKPRAEQGGLFGKTEE